MKFLTSRKGFTLIELLVVIGILAVLAAIAIPSVAGLIDKANVSADSTNANEMTNAIERFASEYELYCQDIASGVIKDGQSGDFDSAQGRVFNVTGATSRADIETLEVAQDAVVADDQIAIYRDTKYPANAKTARLIMQNYTKTSSSVFEPKQSDMHYWYSPDCGVVVFAEPTASKDALNDLVHSGMDAKGNPLSGNTKWVDLTTSSYENGEGVEPTGSIIPTGGKLIRNLQFRQNNDGTCSRDYTNAIMYNAGEYFPDTLMKGDVYVYGNYEYCYGYEWCECAMWSMCCDCDNLTNGWAAKCVNQNSKPGQLLGTINNIPLTSIALCFSGFNIKTSPQIPNTVTSMYCAFKGCELLETVPQLPSSVVNLSDTFSCCTSLKNCNNVRIPDTAKDMWGTFQNCTNLSGTIRIDANPNSIDDFDCLFNGTTKEIILTGVSPKLQEFANTSSLGNVKVQ